MLLKKAVILSVLSASISACSVAEKAIAKFPAIGSKPSQPQPSPQPQPERVPQYVPPVRNAIGPELGQLVYDQWRAFPGKTGIAVERIDGGGLVGRRLDDLFPQQSVSKIWVALAVLDSVDRGELSLDKQIRIGFDDFTMFQSIVKKQVEREGSITVSVRRLLELAVTKSDNTANDKLMWVIGGPQAVRDIMARKRIRNIRFGPGERDLQSGVAGFAWKQEYGPGNRWFTARAKVSAEKRRTAINNYLANPVDGATPRGMVAALGRLARGELLSAQSTQMLLGLMRKTTSGPNRLKAGVPSGWGFGHKTGTGQAFAGVSTGYNDVGIMTAPDGTRYAVAVLLAHTTAPIIKRMRMMQSITRGVGQYHIDE